MTQHIFLNNKRVNFVIFLYPKIKIMKAKFVLKRKEKRKVNKVVIDKTNSLDSYNNQCLLDPDPRKYADPDKRGKISTKNCNKKILISKPKSELLKKERL